MRAIFSRCALSGALFALPLLIVPVSAQFIVPVEVSGGSGINAAPALVRDGGDNMVVFFERSGDLYQTSSRFGFPEPTNVTQSADPSGQVHLTLGASFFLIHAVYEEGVAGVRDIFLVDNNGGSFAEPVNVSQDAADSQSPVVLVNSMGALDLVWESDGQIVWSRNEGPQLAVATGAQPCMADAGSDRSFVAYERGGDLFGRVYDQGSFGPEFTIADLPQSCEDLALASDLAETIVGVFRSGGSLYSFSFTASGGLTPPFEEVAGPLDGPPDVAIRSSGQVAVMYPAAGEVRLLDGALGDLGLPQSVGGAEGGEDPMIALDSHGFSHVVFARADAIFYTNNVPAPQADFSFTPSSGTLPVPVQFTDLSSGVITDYAWNFGDGEGSGSVEPNHLYTLPGVFTVSLTVTGPGGSDTKTVPAAVSTVLPENVIELQSIPAFSGQPIVHPVLADHPDPLQGYQLALIFDSGVTDISGVSLEGTSTAPQSPEFIFTDIVENGPTSTLVYVVILDFVQPFDGRTIIPGERQILAALEYEIPFPLPLGTQGVLHFPESVGDPPISNIFTAEGGISVSPYTLDGTVTVEAQPQFLFIRSDANFDQSVNIGDAIFTLNFLFAGGAGPPCPDSADSNDDGGIDVGDAIYLLNWLFANGAAIPYPYPGLGLDPTEDGLGPCLP